VSPSRDAGLLRRHPANPVLTAADLTYPAELVFNPAVVRWRDGYLMAFRVDDGWRPGTAVFDRTVIGLAESDDGVTWRPRPTPWIDGAASDALRDHGATRAYDPRLTVVDGVLYLCFAVDTAHGIRGAVARVDGDLVGWTLLDLTVPDDRNLALFPERIGGLLWRLHRPFAVYGRGAPEAFDLWASASPDGVHWGRARLVLASDQVPWANAKIGPGAPPVRVAAGWLAFFHAVTIDPARDLPAWHPGWRKTYTAGAMVLDAREPWRVLGLCREPLLVPEAAYEREGFRGHVVFPGGAVAEATGEVKLYYGAADTCVAVAMGDAEAIAAHCLVGGPPTVR
jgi:beta-1,4-mannooligosaccharide/beta-1,4-mannosyl-N-acetylglucosamine phosphorylase